MNVDGMIKSIRRWWYGHRRMWVTLDARDSSLTLSESVYKHILVTDGLKAAKVFVFRIPETGNYGFIMNPEIEQSTQLCDLQYNTKHRCIGFETLCPTVSRMLYDYGIYSHDVVRLTVKARETAKLRYYEITKL